MESSVMDVSCGRLPTTDQADLIQQATQLAAHNPATIGEPFLADLFVATTLATRM